MEPQKQFRAIVVCSTDPCSYCCQPAAREPQHLLKDTYDEALEYGRGMSQHVYGASVHRVEIEERDVSPWRPAEQSGEPARSQSVRRRLGEAELRAADPADLTEWELLWRDYLLQHPEVLASRRYQNGYLPMRKG